MKISLNGEWKYLVDPKNVGIKKAWWRVEWISAQPDSLKLIVLPNRTSFLN